MSMILEGAQRRAWQFWIDRGGTFTDIVAVTPEGRIETAKLLSENPSRYADAVLEGIRRFLKARPAGERRIGSVKIGTTVATNALLERRGARTVFVTTAGFADVLRIGSQQRPDIFALDVVLPPMLYECVIEAQERISATGEIIEPLDEPGLERDLRAAVRNGYVSAAIAFLHAYRYPEHERRAAEIAARAGFAHVSISHNVSPLIKLVERGDTTVADAYLTPVLGAYVERVRAGLGRDEQAGRRRLLFMQSHGGLVGADAFRGRDSVFSGPAGGVVGMADAALASGHDHVIGFDMGGTSTDVCLYAGKFERTATAVVAGVRIAAPMLAIETVAAGGGSILEYASGRLQVGPASAGALPGPACYRNGGPLTLTDANVLLGRIQADFFPRVFGPGADEPIDTAAVDARFAELAARVSADTSSETGPAELASGFLRVAVERMAAAIKHVSVQRGHDPRQFALSCFGGAGGQHACQVADALGIGRVLIDPLAGVLSAYGIGVADVRSIRAAPIGRRLEAECLADVDTDAERLAAALAEALRGQHAELAELRFERRVRLGVAGSDATFPVDYTPGMPAAELADRFAALHGRLFGFGFGAEGRNLVVESIEVEAVASMPRPRRAALARAAVAPVPVAERRAWFADAWRNVPVYARASLGAGDRLDGPAIVAEANATTVIEPQWRGAVDELGVLVLTRTQPRAEREAVGAERDPTMLEIFNNRFAHVAEQMGAVLEQTAHSVNIKERLDYSCALFDGAGGLVANAPHVPVHLGSMGDSVRAVLDAFAADIRAGDAFVLNAPYQGGTHLPDITVVTPVFLDAQARPIFIVASRAHHADIGGRAPGSMPAQSTHIDEEGVLFAPMPIVRGGAFLERDVRAALAGGAYPARNPDQNVADLKAQLAANAKGVEEILAMVRRFGAEAVAAYMAHVKANAAECVERAVRRLAPGAWTLELDGGERVCVAVRVDAARGEAWIDFSGTSPTSAGNYNAPASIARAVVLYVFRTLVAERIPLNAGCLEPLHIELPPGSLVNPSYPAAVAAGNVETSQCIADALLAALGACAASQGTMNNLTFGNAEHQYYETLCGGCGAGPGFDGASAVHSHMTNSRLTDIEVLEHRYPVRVRRFAVRRGSGGAGRWRGGDGVIREIEFLAPMQASILSNRRRTAPFGLAGGADGAPGRNTIVRASGAVERVGAAAEMEFAAGERFVIETPGGGGYGTPEGTGPRARQRSK